MAHLPLKVKRCKSDQQDDEVAQKPIALLVQDELADKFKLARAKDFAIQGSRNGMVLSCGEEVHRAPENSRFRIRIYDRDRNHAGNLRDYIQISIDQYEKMKDSEDYVRRALRKHPRAREHIFHHDSFTVTVVSVPSTGPMVELCKQGTRIYMDKKTFSNMMTYEETLANEYEDYRKHKEDNVLLLGEFMDLMAFISNEGRVNEWVSGPPVWYQAGIVTTWRKLDDQVSKFKERARKKGRFSDKSMP